jgi:hypothetical protein
MQIPASAGVADLASRLGRAMVLASRLVWAVALALQLVWAMASQSGWQVFATA